MQFTKKFINEKYVLLYNKNLGLEILSGINGKPDPFFLELPSLIDIGIMGTCKHRCKFCYQGHEDKPNMKLEDFKSIINQVDHHVNQVALGGRGDPNHHENFKEIIEYCVQHNIVPNYTTSGIDLKDEHIQISKMCGAVAVSDYEKQYTSDAIYRFLCGGIKTNVHQIFSKETFEKCMNIIIGNHPYVNGLNAVIFLLFKPQGAGKNLDLVPTEDQIKEFSNIIFKANLPFKVGMDSCLVNHVVDYAVMTELQRMSLDTCEGARMSMYITPDMKMKPCSFGDSSYETPVTKTNLKEIWDGKIFSDFRYVLSRKSNQCPFRF